MSEGKTGRSGSEKRRRSARGVKITFTAGEWAVFTEGVKTSGGGSPADYIRRSADAGAGRIKPAKSPKVDIQEIERLCGETKRVGTMANTLARLGHFGEDLTAAEIDRLCQEVRGLVETVTVAIKSKSNASSPTDE